MATSRDGRHSLKIVLHGTELRRSSAVTSESFSAAKVDAAVKYLFLQLPRHYKSRVEHENHGRTPSVVTIPRRACEKRDQSGNTPFAISWIVGEPCTETELRRFALNCNYIPRRYL